MKFYNCHLQYVIISPSLQPLLVSRLFRGVVAETSERARQVALSGLLTLCYTNFQRISTSRFFSAEKTALLRNCLVTLLRCARISNRAVALTAISMLQALTECSDMVFDVNPTYPLLIIQVSYLSILLFHCIS